jgi:hypothetical protein
VTAVASGEAGLRVRRAQITGWQRKSSVSSLSSKTPSLLGKFPVVKTSNDTENKAEQVVRL